VFDTIDMDSLLKILTLRTKKELEAFARESVVHSADFASLILACKTNAMPWAHQMFVHDHMPTHLALTDKDREAMSNAKVGPHTKGTKKATNKIFQFFKERRWLVGHIFYNDDLSDWHFFYFDQRDQDDESNHWEHGPHIHFVNVLWPTLDPQKVWENFCVNSDTPKGALHLRFSRPQVPEPTVSRRG